MFKKFIQRIIEAENREDAMNFGLMYSFLYVSEHIEE